MEQKLIDEIAAKERAGRESKSPPHIIEMKKTREEIRLLTSGANRGDTNYWHLQRAIYNLYFKCQKGQCMEFFEPIRISNMLMNKFHISIIPKET